MTRILLAFHFFNLYCTNLTMPKGAVKLVRNIKSPKIQRFRALI